MDDLDLMSAHDADTFLEIKEPYNDMEEVHATSMAVLIRFHYLDADIWVAKQHLRIDTDNNLYMKDWVYRQHFES